MKATGAFLVNVTQDGFRRLQGTVPSRNAYVRGRAIVLIAVLGPARVALPLRVQEVFWARRIAYDFYSSSTHEDRSKELSITDTT